VGSQVIAAGLQEEQFRIRFALKLLQRQQVRCDVFSDGRVRAASCLDCSDFLRFKCAMSDKELSVFFGENVVRYRGKPYLFAKVLTESQHERGFAATDGPADPDGECALGEIPPKGLLSLVEMTRPAHFFVRVPISVMMMVVVIVVVIVT
jgi:hypothetical protein